MPTGVHVRDARRQLFEAAERVLLRDGANALTSRAVTDETGCAKGSCTDTSPTLTCSSLS